MSKQSSESSKRLNIPPNLDIKQEVEVLLYSAGRRTFLHKTRKLEIFCETPPQLGFPAWEVGAAPQEVEVRTGNLYFRWCLRLIK